MANNEIEVKVVGDSKPLEKTLDDVEKLSKKRGTDISSALSGSISSGMTGAFMKLAGAAAAAGAAVAGAFTFKKAVDAAIEAQDATNRFNSSLVAAGKFSEEASTRFQEYAKSLQSITTVGDDLIVQNAALLVSVGKLSGEGLEKATKAALDLSAGMNIGVEQAFEMVSKAAAGSTAAFGKYGMKIDESLPQSEKFAAVLAQINGRFKDMAEGKVATFSGQLAQLQNLFGDILEELGKFVTRSPAVIKIMSMIGDAFKSVIASLSSIDTDILGNLIRKLLSFGQGFVTYVVAPLELAYNIGKLFGAALVTGFASIGLAVLQFNVLFNEYVRDPIANFIINGVGKLIGVFNKDLAQSITSSMQSVLASANEGTIAARDMAATAVESMAGVTETAFANILNFDASSTASGMVEKMKLAIEPLGTTLNEEGVKHGKQYSAGIEQGLDLSFTQAQLSQAWTAVSQDTALKMGSMVKSARDFAANMQQFMVGGISKSVEAMGTALARGENFMVALGRTVLNVFADILIQLGTQILAVGLLMSTVPILFGLQGGAAIAAGLGMILAGGVLKGLAGGGGGGGGGASSGAGATSGGGVATTADSGLQAGAASTQIAQEAERKPTSEIQVVVQGNILDRRQTGLELVDVLNEAFGTDGARFARSTV